MQCPSCNFTQTCKNGYRRGVQSYRCKQCGRQFLQTYRQLRYSDEMKQRCLDLYFSGMGVKAIERATQVHHTTVLYWIQRVSFDPLGFESLFNRAEETSDRT
ncbi:IS1 family transposase [aff. Roholtiella sp. LEGE 12411]|uniref:IS1 family transposase n=1 Tax=aff. Roholtiella sp. LEGE 12411 TaxID=1828822 RepID=UPI00187F4930|nr:IS1 family transposase [aff. Roholtiella sp. LEGE 12411]MBE9036228.1 IS1 family transposase [aff. Roholtiella sp. LEGE 12411]